MIVHDAGKCHGHTSFITHLDWSNDSGYLRSNSGDYELLYWEAATGKQFTDVSTLSTLRGVSAKCPPRVVCACGMSVLYVCLCVVRVWSIMGVSWDHKSHTMVSQVILHILLSYHLFGGCGVD